MKIGIDLGTANVLVYVKGKSIVITEPSVVAVSDANRIVAVREEAREIVPSHIDVGPAVPGERRAPLGRRHHPAHGVGRRRAGGGRPCGRVPPATRLCRRP